jgi:hypothetical protein
MTGSSKLLFDIEAFLRESGMNASFFGKAAVGDPNFVGDVRNGRRPHLDLIDKVEAYLRSARAPRVDPRTVAERMAAKLEDISVEIGSRVARHYSDISLAPEAIGDVALDVLMEWLVGNPEGNKERSKLFAPGAISVKNSPVSDAACPVSDVQNN